MMGKDLTPKQATIALAVGIFGMMAVFYIVMLVSGGHHDTIEWLLPVLLFIGVFLLLPVVAILQSILGLIGAAVIGGLLYVVSRLLPQRTRTWLAGKTDRNLTPLASTLAFAAAIACLVSIFCFTTGDPKGVLIFTFGISMVIGFFALIHHIDIRWRTHRNQKRTANQASDATSETAPGADSSSHQG